MVDEKGNRYTTELRYVNGLLTWIAVGLTCLIAGNDVIKNAILYVALYEQYFKIIIMIILQVHLGCPALG